MGSIMKNGNFFGGNVVYTPEIKKDNNNVYSEDEIVVGKWIDGKPLYQKTIVYNSKVNSGTTQISHGIDNVDEIIKNEVVAKSNNGTVPIPSISSNSVWTILVSGIDENVIEFNSGSEIANYLNRFYITLQYTKTTD